MPEHRILTLHMPQRAAVMDELLSAVEKSLLAVGAERIWIDSESGYDLTVMAELPTSGDPTGAVPEPRAAAQLHPHPHPRPPV